SPSNHGVYSPLSLMLGADSFCRGLKKIDARLQNANLASMKSFRPVILLLLLALIATWFFLPGIVERYFNHTLQKPPYTGAPEAQALHKQLLVADLHADTLFWGRNLLTRGTWGHVDLHRLVEGGVAVQAFTVVTTVPRNLNINRNSDSTDMVRY